LTNAVDDTLADGDRVRRRHRHSVDAKGTRVNTALQNIRLHGPHLRVVLQGNREAIIGVKWVHGESCEHSNADRVDSRVAQTQLSDKLVGYARDDRAHDNLCAVGDNRTREPQLGYLFVC
jgi:hypothetical protein